MDMSVSITVRLYFTVEKVVLSRGSDRNYVGFYFFVFMDFKNGKLTLFVSERRRTTAQSDNY